MINLQKKGEEYMKSEKGITLTSLAIYIMVVIIVVGILATITVSLRSNIKDINKEGTSDIEIDKFNMYFLQDVKKQGNQIATISDSEIVFTLGNKYNFKDDNVIYLNDNIKIAEDIEKCSFANKLENGKQIIYVTIKTQNGNERTIEYTLNDDTNNLAYNEETNYIHNTYYNTPKNSDGTLTANATYTSDGYTAIVPKGFKIIEGTEGKQSIAEGLVIQDGEGNEFVWIPCTRQDYENATIDDSWPTYEYKDKDKEWTDTQTSIGAKSIEENGGFYVARYEAGIPENADFFADSEGDTYYLKNKKNTTAYKPVSKKGVPAWNFISQTNAVEVSKAMYANNSTVNSYLIDSHAWNYICKNILKGKVGKDITSCSDWGNYKNNTTTKYENLDVLYAVHEYDNGWKKYADGETSGANSKYHKGIIPKGTAPKDIKSNICLELATGASEDFKAYNIYDMAGNMWEWTTETETNSNTTYSVFRGGSFVEGGTGSPVVRAYGAVTKDGRDIFIGFRVVLYL